MKKLILSALTCAAVAVGFNSYANNPISINMMVEAAKSDGIKESMMGFNAAVQNSVKEMLTRLNSGDNYYMIDLVSTGLFQESHICEAKVKTQIKSVMTANEKTLLGAALDNDAPVAIMTMKFCSTGNHPFTKDKLIQYVFADGGTIGGKLILDLEKAVCYTNIAAQGQLGQVNSGGSQDSPVVPLVSGILGQSCYEELSLLTPPSSYTFVDND